MENQHNWSLSPLVRIFVVILVLGAIGLSLMAFAADAAIDRSLVLQDEQDEPDQPHKPFMPFLARGGFHGLGQRGWLGVGGEPNYDSFLAQALGISVQELQEAYVKANDAVLEQAIAKGYLTQEQADLMKARHALMQYIDRDGLMAEALGISVERLEAARQEDRSLSALFEELGLEVSDVRAALQAAYEELVKKAVEEGILTQNQADQILCGDSIGPFFGGRPGFRGRRGFPRGECPCPPEPDSDTATGTSF